MFHVTFTVVLRHLTTPPNLDTVSPTQRKDIRMHEICEWFVLCDNVADQVVVHPILGDVPTCQRCVDKLHLTPKSWHSAFGIAKPSPIIEEKTA